MKKYMDLLLLLNIKFGPRRQQSLLTTHYVPTRKALHQLGNVQIHNSVETWALSATRLRTEAAFKRLSSGGRPNSLYQVLQSRPPDFHRSFCWESVHKSIHCIQHSSSVLYCHRKEEYQTNYGIACNWLIQFLKIYTPNLSTRLRSEPHFAGHNVFFTIAFCVKNPYFLTIFRPERRSAHS